MALEGSLRDFDLFSLFNMIKIQGKNGTLVLSQGQEFVKVFFENGEIVGCDSNQVRMEDRLGAMLVRMGRLTGDELLGMIQVQRQTLKRMGTLLLEAGKVTPADLEDALFTQARSLLHRTFRWVEGDYRFDSLLPADLDREHFIPIPVDTVLMEAARIQDEWPLVERRLPGLETPLARTARAQALRLDIDRDLTLVLEGHRASHGDTSGLSHLQEVVLRYFERAQSPAEVVQISRYEELDTCKAIADLLELGLLEPARQPEIQLPRDRTPDASAAARAPEWHPSGLLWPLTALALAGALVVRFPWSGGAWTGSAATQEAQGATRTRAAWVYRMASPREGGSMVAREVGVPAAGALPAPDLTRLPDPMAPAPPVIHPR